MVKNPRAQALGLTVAQAPKDKSWDYLRGEIPQGVCWD